MRSVERGQVGGPEEGRKGAPSGCGRRREGGGGRKEDVGRRVGGESLEGQCARAGGSRATPRAAAAAARSSCRPGSPGLGRAAPRLCRTVGAGVLLLPLGPAILEPDFDLRLSEAERQREVQALAHRQVARGPELVLQSHQLLIGESGARAPRFGTAGLGAPAPGPRGAGRSRGSREPTGAPLPRRQRRRPGLGRARRVRLQACCPLLRPPLARVLCFVLLLLRLLGLRTLQGGRSARAAIRSV